MTIIESIKNYISDCPHLEKLAKVKVDFLPSDPTTYSIEQTPSEPYLEKWIYGGGVKQLTFVFASRMFYSDELANNIDNCGFFENFQNWLEEQTENDNLPELEEGMTATQIEAISSGYLFDITGNLDNARYQIQCRLIYEKEG